MIIASVVRRKNSRDIVATVTLPIEGNIEGVFDYVTGEGVLPEVLTGFGLLPAVSRTSGNTGPWDRPGSIRTVHLADDSTSREQVTAFKRPGHFAYRTSEYTFAADFFASSATGEWWFEEATGGTSVRWAYTFHARSRWKSLLLMLFMHTQWLGYMRVCANNLRMHFEGVYKDD